ncbi:MAG: DoxX family protein [Myxococcales bacterium]
MNARTDTLSIHSEVHPRKALNIGLWIAQVLLAVAFGMAGLMKLTTPIEVLAQNMNWVADQPWLVRFIGGSEVAGALGMLLPALTRILPRLTALAGLGLVVVMVLAAGFHATRGELGAIPVTLILGSLAAFVAWGRFRAAPIPSR